MIDGKGSGTSVGEQGGEKTENKKSIPLAEILAAVQNREDLTEEEKRALETLCPKILETANQLAEPKLPPDKKEHKEEEEVDDFKKETGENGRRMVEVIKALLEREDLSAGSGDFNVKGRSGLANLRIDIKANLSRCLSWWSDTDLAVEKKRVDGNNFFALDLLYGVVNADVGGELGQEIEEKLKPLFEERFELLNLALKEQGHSAMEWRHPRAGELFNPGENVLSGNAERDEEIDRGRVKAVVEPGRVQRHRQGDGGAYEILRNTSKVIMSSGR